MQLKGAPIFKMVGFAQSHCSRNLIFQAAWFADPVFFGDYPDEMKDLVGDRLPSFTSAQSARIKGSHDFYGQV